MQKVNRQRFSLNLGLAIMAFHVIYTLLMWFVITIPDKSAAVTEITTPVTIGYAVAVLKYFLDSHGLVTSEEVIGIRLAIMIVGLVTAFAAALVGAPVVFLNNADMTAETLNSFLVAAESGFGALLALIFSYLYKAR